MTTEFDNREGIGVVAFDPWNTQGGGFYEGLCVGGERIFDMCAPCGTCGVLFQRLANTEHRLTDAEAVDILADLESIPGEDGLRKLSRILAPGKYVPIIVEASVSFVQPGDADDYFVRDFVPLFGLDAPDYESAPDPRTPYYRVTWEQSVRRKGRLSGVYQALRQMLVVPLHEPEQLDPERLAYWEQEAADGRALTGFAVGVLDLQAPATEPFGSDPAYGYEEHQVLVAYLLDGHHRLHAAAAACLPIRLLCMIDPAHSLADPAEINAFIDEMDIRRA